MISIVVVMIYNFFGAVWTAIIVGILGALYLYNRWESNYFTSRGIKSIPSRIPFLGNMFKVFIQKEHISDVTRRLYTTFPDEKYVGIRQFNKPIVLIKDLELIKQIGIKDFDFFQDHIQTIDETLDPLFGSNLVALRGQKWRDMRSTLSPAFTSSKMKGMFQFVAECGDEMTQYFKEQLDKPENQNKEYLEIDLKDIFTRYTNDVIATSAFGIKVNSLKERDNTFYTMGKEATNFTGKALIKFFFMIIFPGIMKMLGIRILNEKVSNFFRNLVQGTMDTREKQNISRPDMIQLLMEAKKGSLKHDDGKDDTVETGFATVQESSLVKQAVKTKWSDDEIIAQAVIFFLAGFETSSNLLCFMAHELAANPDIQRRLQAEVDLVSQKSDGKVSYTDLHAMKYMDMVVTETLRLWPPGVALDRKCVKPYTLPPPNDSSKTGIMLNVNDGIWLSIYDIHTDPKYYEHPMKFDPERFSDENKASINPQAYLPFGIGPRNCIGSRFALMECKAIMFQILQKFDLVPTAKTGIPVEIKNNAFNFVPKNGFWVGIKPRKNI